MQFLKGLLWFLLAVVIAVFVQGNWNSVPVKLWGGMIADINLPVLLLFAFLLGFLPMLIWHQAVRWRLKQRLSTAERALAPLPEPIYPAMTPNAEPTPAAP